MESGTETAGVSTSGVAAMPVLGDFLASDRVVVDLEVTSQKRLLEQLAELVSMADDEIDLRICVRK